MGVRRLPSVGWDESLHPRDHGRFAWKGGRFERPGISADGRHGVRGHFEHRVEHRAAEQTGIGTRPAGHVVKTVAYHPDGRVMQTSFSQRFATEQEAKDHLAARVRGAVSAPREPLKSAAFEDRVAQLSKKHDEPVGVMDHPTRRGWAIVVGANRDGSQSRYAVAPDGHVHETEVRPASTGPSHPGSGEPTWRRLYSHGDLRQGQQVRVHREAFNVRKGIQRETVEGELVLVRRGKSHGGGAGSATPPLVGGVIGVRQENGKVRHVPLQFVRHVDVAEGGGKPSPPPPGYEFKGEPFWDQRAKRWTVIQSSESGVMVEHKRFYSEREARQYMGLEGGKEHPGPPDDTPRPRSATTPLDNPANPLSKFDTERLQSLLAFAQKEAGKGRSADREKWKAMGDQVVAELNHRGVRTENVGPVVHVQGVGAVPAVPAGELRKGDHRVYNTGARYRVENVERKGGFVHLRVRSEEGKQYSSKHRPTTMLAVDRQAEMANPSGPEPQIPRGVYSVREEPGGMPGETLHFIYGPDGKMIRGYPTAAEANHVADRMTRERPKVLSDRKGVQVVELKAIGGERARYSVRRGEQPLKGPFGTPQEAEYHASLIRDPGGGMASPERGEHPPLTARKIEGGTAAMVTDMLGRDRIYIEKDPETQDRYFFNDQITGDNGIASEGGLEGAMHAMTNKLLWEDTPPESEGMGSGRGDHASYDYTDDPEGLRMRFSDDQLRQALREQTPGESAPLLKFDFEERVPREAVLKALRTDEKSFQLDEHVRGRQIESDRRIAELKALGEGTPVHLLVQEMGKGRRAGWVKGHYVGTSWVGGRDSIRVKVKGGAGDRRGAVSVGGFSSLHSGADLRLPHEPLPEGARVHPAGVDAFGQLRGRGRPANPRELGGGGMANTAAQGGAQFRAAEAQVREAQAAYDAATVWGEGDPTRAADLLARARQRLDAARQSVLGAYRSDMRASVRAATA